MGCCCSASSSQETLTPENVVIETVETSLQVPHVAYVVTFSQEGISLNDYFADVEEWNEMKGLNLHLKKVNPSEIQLALSYRHLNKVIKNKKYLTLDCMQFILKYKDETDLEGIWIDCLCISPAGQALQEAFAYMGIIYSTALVFPYWIEQPDNEAALNRGWIYQESRFSTLHFGLFGFYKSCEEYHPILSSLTSERINCDFQGGRGRYDCEEDSSPSLNGILKSFLGCDIEYESDLFSAIFGVCASKHAKVNCLAQANNPDAVAINSTSKDRFLRLFGFSVDILSKKDLAIKPEKSKSLIVMYSRKNEIWISSASDVTLDPSMNNYLQNVKNRKILGNLSIDYALIPPLLRKQLHPKDK